MHILIRILVAIPLLCALTIEVIPVVQAARWDRDDYAPPSAVPIIPWIIYGVT